MRRALAATFLLALAAHPAAAEVPADVVVVIGADGRATVTGATLAEEVPGASYVVDVDLATSFAVAEVRVTGFDVARPRQLVPEYDDRAQHPDADHLHPHAFHEIARDLAADDTARLLNTTRTADGFVHRLGLTGPGPARLLLTRDVTPPSFRLGNVTDVTTYGFLYRTSTDEFAIADLRIRPAAGGDEVENPTAVLALEQTFPVQGLDPDTEYVFHVRFTDWAGNVAESEAVRVRTAPEPDRPKPTIVAVTPENGSRVAEVAHLVVEIESPEPVELDGVRFFVDRTPVRDGVSLVPGVSTERWRATYALPEPLAPGRHTVAVEVANAAGGEALARWAFEVEAPAVAPGAGVALVLAAALFAARRR